MWYRRSAMASLTDSSNQVGSPEPRAKPPNRPLSQQHRRRRLCALVGCTSTASGPTAGSHSPAVSPASTRHHTRPSLRTHSCTPADGSAKSTSPPQQGCHGSYYLLVASNTLQPRTASRLLHTLTAMRDYSPYSRTPTLHFRIHHPPHVPVLVKPSPPHPTYRSPDPPNYFTHSKVDAQSTEVSCPPTSKHISRKAGDWHFSMPHLC